jgi:NhaB family Na+:H+ antiporter
MPRTMPQAFGRNFLGNAPLWYKGCILLFLIANPILLKAYGPFIAGWVLIGEFIFTLAMALKCYPLPAGGLLAIEAVVIGLTKPDTVFKETLANFEVILLLIFMVAGIYFMKDFLRFTFTRILVRVQSKIHISLLFCFAGAFLSAFLDALTVTAVIIAVAYGFYDIYHRYPTAGTLAISALPAQSDDARRGGHRPGRGLYPGGRAAEPVDSQRHGVDLCRLLHQGRAGFPAGAGGRAGDLLPGREEEMVQLRF